MTRAKKKTASRKGKKKPYPPVDIDIPNVTLKTKVSSLTLGQLVDVLVQLHYQLPIQRGRPSAQVVSDAIKQVRDFIESPDSELRKTQTAIIRAMPTILQRAQWAPKDGGPSPHAKGTPPRPPR
jgi:hypothetical protein